MTGQSRRVGELDLRRLATSFQARAFCHAPADQPFDPAALAQPGDDEDRWNGPGERTAYLSGDAATALAECCRHAPPHQQFARSIVRVELRALDVLDLRRPDVLASLGCHRDRRLAMDRDAARAVGAWIRASGAAQGLIVPSMAFLDQPDRFNVVVFVDRLPGGIEAFVRDARPIGQVDLGG